MVALDFMKGGSVREPDWGSILFLGAFVIGFGATAILLYHLQPPWSWRFPIAVAAYVILLIALWLPLFKAGMYVPVLAACVMSMLLGALAVLAVSDRAHWRVYGLGGLFFLVQGVIATSTYWKRVLRNRP
jgi:hypothetical protein